MNHNIYSLVFLVFFLIPGFVSLKIYDWIIPGTKRDFNKSTIEIFGYSALNAAVFLYPFIFFKDHFLNFNYSSWFASIIVLIVIPAIWPIAIIALSKIRLARQFIGHPCPKPWDWVFEKGKEYWILIHLKDGRKIGGYFGKNSYASSFPNPEQLYISELWKVDERGNFLNKIEQTSGVLIDKEQWEFVEFFCA